MRDQMLNDRPRNALMAEFRLNRNGCQFDYIRTVRFQLAASEHPPGIVNRNYEPPPIQIHRVDPDAVNQILDERGLSFRSGTKRKVSQSNLPQP